jgi:hypothetical protein
MTDARHTAHPLRVDSDPLECHENATRP